MNNLGLHIPWGIVYLILRAAHSFPPGELKVKGSTKLQLIYLLTRCPMQLFSASAWSMIDIYFRNHQRRKWHGQWLYGFVFHSQRVTLHLSHLYVCEGRFKENSLRVYLQSRNLLSSFSHRNNLYIHLFFWKVSDCICVRIVRFWTNLMSHQKSTARLRFLQSSYPVIGLKNHSGGLYWSVLDHNLVWFHFSWSSFYII